MLRGGWFPVKPDGPKNECLESFGVRQTSSFWTIDASTVDNGANSAAP